MQNPARLIRQMSESALPRVSAARKKRFCAIVFGLALPFSIGFAIAGFESRASGPAEFISVSAAPDSRKILVTYRSRDGVIRRQSFGRKRTLTDDAGVTLCLADFHKGKLPLGSIRKALRVAGDPSRACSPSD